MASAQPKFILGFALLSFAAYAALLPHLYAFPRPRASAAMEVVVPQFAQVLMAAGDRYLAADFAGFRALVAATENMDADNYRVLGIVQSDVSWFNPAHEDNYYIAAAVLPWNGQVDAAQKILRAASEARRFDWQPAFYYAFNAYHFLKDPQLGADWLAIAADHASSEAEKIQLQQVAAIWAGHGDDLEVAIRLHRAMAKGTPHKAFAHFLEMRALRLENLLLLQRAIVRFGGESPLRLEQLVDASLISAIPVDPFGARYAIGRNGKPEVVTAGPRPLEEKP